jgi:hypothetical protein
VLRTFIALAWFEPATFGSSDKHTNHYTTKATWLSYEFFFLNMIVFRDVAIALKVVSTSETSVNFYQTTLHNIPGDTVILTLDAAVRT